ncbi:MAG: hypothetical protein IJM98_09230 [Oscillospiraceae bacterium]|nr:hypothetical protein [Oscillospiraceae bacterium]
MFLIANDSFCQNIYERYKSKIPTTLPKYEYNGGSLNIPFEENSQELFEAIEIIKEKGYTPRLFSEAYYTKKEIEDKVGYFELSPSYPTELEGTTEKSYGTVLDGGCPCCGVGNVAVGDVLIDRKLMKKCKIGCLIPDYVVSKEVKEIIENNGLTGVTFEKKVKDFKNREMDDFYVMNIKNILPPMSKTTWLNEQELEDGCKICGYRTTYLESDIQYESEKLDNAFDFNLTKEYVNNDWNRYLVVSAKVRKVFKENKIRVGFKPVTLL